MASQEHLEILRQGVEVWNQWRVEHSDVQPNLSGANLHGAELGGVNLSGANLNGAHFHGANLSGANLEGADLEGADLGGIDLSGVDLSGVDLRGINLGRTKLEGVNLSGVDLSGTYFSGANFGRADLSGANLSGADFSGADLWNANLNGANLNGANLNGANLQGASLQGASLQGAMLDSANLSDTSMLKYEREQLRGKGAVGLDKVNVTNEPSEEETLTTEITPTLHSSRKLKVAESTSTLSIRITQQPLTARNLAITTSTLTQLHTQCWLIAIGRFTDLIEYAQTHSPRFDEEANLTIARMIHHSPAEITFNVSLEGVANALRTAIDAVAGMWARKRELELKNAALEEEIRRKKQETEITLTSEKIAQQVALVALYDKQIELRRKQLDLLDYAAEKAPKIVEALHPDADTTTKDMAATALIKALSQLGEAEGLERLLPPPDSKPSSQAS